MMTYALDTNVIIDYLRKNKIIAYNMLKADDDGHILAIPSIVYYEVMRGFKETAMTKRFNAFQILLGKLKLLYLEENNMKALNIAAKIYESIRKTGNLIEDNDIFIAAAAMANDATLVTDNIKHFERVEGLAVVNWK